MYKVLTIDDDLILSDVVAFFLRRVGYQVVQAHDGVTGLDIWQAEQPDVILLDLNLPRMDGFEVLRHIRADSQVPVILMTVRDDEEDVLKGFELGADDYITKPFSVKQMVVRIQAVMRRAGEQPTVPLHRAGPVTLDPARHQLMVNEQPPVALTPKETRLLAYFMLNTNHILTTQAIIEHVWGLEGATQNTLRQLVYRLRAKLDSESGAPATIETVPGVGYVFKVTDPQQEPSG